MSNKKNHSGSIRKLIVLFGSLFDNVRIKRGNDDTDILVPLTYTSKEKFVARLNSINTNSLNNEKVKIETILPRMCYNLVDMQYQSQYKTGGTNYSVVNSKKIYNPIPYKFMFELSIFTRHQSDMFEILEEILPFFGPSFCTRIKERIGDKVYFERDINVTISSISPDLQAEGDYKERRRIEWTIMFEVDGWINHKPIDNVGEIRHIIINFYGNERTIDVEKSLIDVMPDDVKKDDWTGESKITYV